MIDKNPPTLEDLREAKEPSWLWDQARGRAVWANAAGLQFFGCETLFDLVDRPFDPQEPGIQRIAALSPSLKRGEATPALLAFPSAGAAEPIRCLCHPHALPDGRIGVLAIGSPEGAAELAPVFDDLAAVFDALPLPALLAARDGGIRHSNQAARALLPAYRMSSLGGLIGDERRAAELMARLESAGTVSFIERLATRNGARDLRITLKRAGALADNTARVLILMDDVTDRRALERQLQPSPAPAREAPKTMTAEEEAAFLALGKTLNGEAAAAVKPAPAAEPQPAPKPQAPIAEARPAPEAGKPVDIPAFFAAAIEARPGGHIIAKDGVIAYANAEGLKALGFETLKELTEAPGLVDRLAEASQSPSSGALGPDISVSRTDIPWFNGPAECYSLRQRQAPQRNAPAAQAELPIEEPPARKPDARPAAMEPTPSATMTQPEPAEEAPAAEPHNAAVDEELRAILDTASDGIITLDAKGCIRSFSAGAEAIFGYRTAEVVDKPFAELLAPDSRKTLRDYLAALQGPGLAAVFNDGREVAAVVKQGGEVPLFMTISRLQTSALNAATFCAVVRDITQWKRTEKDLREAKEHAELASRQKSEFLAQISHELRTPLNAILGFSEVMRLERFGEIRNEKYRGYINDIHTSGAHLLSLINDLLDLSKVEAGKLELNFTSVNLADTADHAIRLTQDLATSNRVIVRKSFPPGLPNVVADQRSMRQIMLNLLSNAIKFTDPGGQVIISAQMSPAGELKLRVKDTGIGMSAPEIKDALEPFRRVTTEGRERQGTGLGLPLTKALAEANRTVFSLTSEPRKGTLVEITFPVTRVLAE